MNVIQGEVNHSARTKHMNLFEKVGEQSIFILELIFIAQYLMYNNTFAFWVLVGTLINIIINMLTKAQVRRLGEAISHRLPFLGTMCRPIDTDCSRIPEIGYGMPSGHSQIAGFIAAFYYFYSHDTDTFSKPLFGFYCFVAGLIMFSRVSAGMHSIPQVVFGCSIGILIAYGFAWILRWFRIPKK